MSPKLRRLRLIPDAVSHVAPQFLQINALCDRQRASFQGDSGESESLSSHTTCPVGSFHLDQRRLGGDGGGDKHKRYEYIVSSIVLVRPGAHIEFTAGFPEDLAHRGHAFFRLRQGFGGQVRLGFGCESPLPTQLR